MSIMNTTNKVAATSLVVGVAVAWQNEDGEILVCLQTGDTATSARGGQGSGA